MTDSIQGLRNRINRVAKEREAEAAEVKRRANSKRTASTALWAVATIIVFTGLLAIVLLL